AASRLYRRVLHHKLFTYTSCFRVYRRAAVLGLDLERPGYQGVAEILGKLDLQGSRIAEYPTTLGVRMRGCTKIKTVRTIARHLRLVVRLLELRIGAAWIRGRCLRRAVVLADQAGERTYPQPERTIA